MRTFSIMCDHCEAIVEYYKPYQITLFMDLHKVTCKGPLNQAYENYLNQLTPEKKMEHITEQIKDSFK